VSTILKALRRLEQEREAQVERDLRDQVVAHPERASESAARPRIPLLVATGAVGAVLVVALVAWVERGGGQAAPAPSASPAAQAARSAPSLAPARERPAPAPVPDAAARAAERQAQRAVVASEPPAAVRPLAASEPPAAVRPLAASEPPAAVRPLAASEPPAAPRRSAVIPDRSPAPSLPQVAAAARPEPPPAVAPAPRTEPEPAAPVAPVSTVRTKPPFKEEPAPLVHERAGIAGQPEVAARTPLPGLVVERTLWHPDAGRRRAVLQVEGRDGTVELREGDAVGDLVVQQIDPSGVLFLHRGVEIRRRVGARD